MKLTAAWFLLLGAFQLSAAEKPNIVLILVDDMPWYGTPIRMIEDEPRSAIAFREMPRLEAFAKQSMRFSHAYAAAPICGPSRCGIQTGLSGIRSEITMNGGGEREGFDKRARYRSMKNRIPLSRGGLSPDMVTIAEALKPLGYASAHFGKWHSFGGGPGEQGYDAHDGNTENDEGSPGKEGNPKRIFGIANRSIAFMETQVAAEKPFYVQLSHYANHARAEFTAESFARFEKDPVFEKAETPQDKKNGQQWTAMSYDLDKSIGLVLDRIKTLGIEDNTYVVITSDNGHARWNENREILRGDKWTLWETGIRVPMWVRGPEIAAGGVTSELVCGIDFLPTFFDLAGGNASALGSVDGVSLLGLWKGGAARPVKRPSGGLFFHYPHYRNSEPMSVMISGDYKLFHFYDSPDDRVLFNLREDLGEQRNIASRSPERAEDMRRALMDALESGGARMPVPNPDYDPSEIEEGGKVVY